MSGVLGAEAIAALHEAIPKPTGQDSRIGTTPTTWTSAS
jgi:hypothetical protein